MATAKITLTIRAEAANRPPVFSPNMPSEIALKVGETFDLAPFASDPDGDTLTWMMAPPSDYATISTQGILTAVAPGNGVVEIIVDDGRG